MHPFDKLRANPLWAASQASEKKVFLGTPSPEDLTIVALYSVLEAGYSDQAHMTRAFRRFGNFTPSMPEAAPVVEVDCGAWPKRSRRERTGQPHSATT